MRSHQQVEHTADLALQLRGSDEVELLRAGMDAVVEILTDGAALSAGDERVVQVDAVDAEDRLVRWLNEVVFVATVESFLPTDADIELTRAGLRARLRGQANARDQLRTEIKSATYHDLHMRRDGDDWVARVVLDV